MFCYGPLVSELRGPRVHGAPPTPSLGGPVIWHRMNHSVKRRRQTLHQTHHHYYLNISVEAANLSDWWIESNRKNQFGSENQIESKLFCRNWNALPLPTCPWYATETNLVFCQLIVSCHSYSKCNNEPMFSLLWWLYMWHCSSTSDKQGSWPRRIVVNVVANAKKPRQLWLTGTVAGTLAQP